MSVDNRVHEFAGRCADGGLTADTVRELEPAGAIPAARP
jgi:hypothetical protein